MNSSMIRFILGRVLRIEAILLLLPTVVSVYYKEGVGRYYIAVAIGTFAVGCLLSVCKPKSNVFYLKEGCVMTALSWILMSIVGCLPFWLSGEIPAFADALFETISGFTTTGASILSNVEALSHCALFWRSFTHWIGGMGVLVFLLAVMPLNGGSPMNLMRAESPGPSVGKLVPKVHQTARLLYLIYVGLTILEFLFLLAGHMPIFDSICTSFGTAGTGGFGIRNDSFASYSAYLQWVVTIFMILFGVNFNAFYFLVFGEFRKALSMEEVRYYFLTIVVAIGLIVPNTRMLYHSLRVGLRHAAFQVASIITTTGFSTADFDQWSQASKTVLVILMFVGACAGSTGGGIKVSRFIMLIKSVRRELVSYIHPKSIMKIKMDGKPVEHGVARSVNVYFISFVLVFVASVFLVSIEGRDMTTNFTAVAATINNIGPGLELVGPSRNFGFFSDGAKYVLMFDMLAGRLELFPLLILFYPTLWKEMFERRMHIHREPRGKEKESC
ncbi:trk system potassium uptake protein TrkH [Lachnospiraceae bacterium XBB1006]|nr:trk system potassium uptake protein TrkH [Lachnospiraceae bacterium XBB1006]